MSSNRSHTERWAPLRDQVGTYHKLINQIIAKKKNYRDLLGILDPVVPFPNDPQVLYDWLTQDMGFPPKLSVALCDFFCLGNKDYVQKTYYTWRESIEDIPLIDQIIRW